MSQPASYSPEELDCGFVVIRNHHIHQKYFFFFSGVIVIKVGILKSLLGFAKTNEQH